MSYLWKLQLKSRNKRNTQKSTSDIPENDIKMQQDDRSKETGEELCKTLIKFSDG